MNDISLKQHQIDHYYRIKKILEKWYVYNDNSPTGAGKTVITIAVAKSFGFDLIIIAPPTIHSNWITHAKKYNVNILACISYQALRGVKGKELSHGKLQLLTKDEHDNYYPTKKFVEILKKGVLIIFDEFHSLKNENTSQLDSSHVIVNTVIATNSPSRVGLISATPGDKLKHSFSLLRMLGMCYHRTLFENEHGKIHPSGMFQIYKMAEYINPEKLIELVPDGLTSVNEKNSMKVVYDLYSQIFVEWACTSTPQVKITTKNDLRNGFFHFGTKDLLKLREAYDNLAQSLEYNNGDLVINKSAFSQMTKTFVNMEQTKVRTMVRLAEEKLSQHKNNKVVLYFTYRSCIDAAAELLKEYRPQIIDGRSKKEDRAYSVERFQRPDSRYRVIIGQISVASSGISLDDTDGNFPRTQYSVPSYRITDVMQLCGRTCRANTKSDTATYLVFCKDVPEENKLINTLGQKSRTMKTYKMEHSDDKIVYPGQFPNYFEKEHKIYDDEYAIDFEDDEYSDDDYF